MTIDEWMDHFRKMAIDPETPVILGVSDPESLNQAEDERVERLIDKLVEFKDNIRRNIVNRRRGLED